METQSASHMGESWQQLVRSVKEQVLISLFTETEYIGSCRPLTFVSFPYQHKESFMPNYFLIEISGGVTKVGLLMTSSV